jgi:putative IMPACT (imprinted ancient) family translation regulator
MLCEQIYALASNVLYEYSERKSRRYFHRVKRVLHRNAVKNFVSKMNTTDVLIDRKLKHHHCLSTQEKLESTDTQLEHLPHKALKHFTQEMGISAEYPRTATKLLKL